MLLIPRIHEAPPVAPENKKADPTSIESIAMQHGLAMLGIVGAQIYAHTIDNQPAAAGVDALMPYVHTINAIVFSYRSLGLVQSLTLSAEDIQELKDLSATLQITASKRTEDYAE